MPRTSLSLPRRTSLLSFSATARRTSFVFSLRSGERGQAWRSSASVEDSSPRPGMATVKALAMGLHTTPKPRWCGGPARTGCNLRPVRATAPSRLDGDGTCCLASSSGPAPTTRRTRSSPAQSALGRCAAPEFVAQHRALPLTAALRPRRSRGRRGDRAARTSPALLLTARRIGDRSTASDRGSSANSGVCPQRCARGDWNRPPNPICIANLSIRDAERMDG